MNEPNEKEIKALEALIAGAMLPEINCENLNKDDLDALMKRQAEPLVEDLAALEKLGNPFRVIQRRSDFNRVNALAPEMVTAMNRKNAADKVSEQTRAELERRARELLG